MNQHKYRRASTVAWVALVGAMLVGGGCDDVDSPSSATVDDQPADPVQVVAADTPDSALPAVVAPNVDVDREANVIARFAVGPGERTVVSFYEPTPGNILYGETGPAGVSPLADVDLLRHSTPVDVYEYLTGLEAPRALVEANERYERALSEGDLTERPTAPESGGTNSNRQIGTPSDGGATRSSCSATWFQSNWCPSGAYSVEFCLLNWWNGAYWYHSSANSVYSTVCADIGDVGHKVTAPGFLGTWTVLEGYYDHRYLYNGSDGLFRTDVIWASSNRFHFGGFINDW